MSEARNQRKWLASLHRAMGESRRLAAENARCSERQLQRWEESGDEDYEAFFEEHRRRVRREGWAAAWNVLRKALESDDLGVSLKAAQAILRSVDGLATRHIEIAAEVAMSPFEKFLQERGETLYNTLTVAESPELEEI